MMRAFLCFFAAVSLSTAAPLYSITNLGTAGGHSATAFDVSNGGYIAGTVQFPTLATSGAIWDGSSDRVLDGALSTADAVNSSGAVVGTSWHNGAPRATVWSGSSTGYVMQGSESYGTAINDAGEIAGNVHRNGRSSAFVTKDGEFVTIDTPGFWSSAYDMNNNGAVTGTYLGLFGSRAFVWSEDGGLQNLGTLGGIVSSGQGINEAGVVVGASTTRSGALHAFLYDGIMRDLGTLGGSLSSAYAVNDQNQAVGYSQDARNRQRAFVWMDGIMFDLNTLIDPDANWTLEAAYGINDQGQIVGVGRLNGVTSAFLLNPESSDPSSAVPEPGTGYLLTGASGALLLLHLRRRRNRVPRA